MKDIRFHISLYITIPVIFAGFAILSIIVTYNTTTYYLSKAMNPRWPATLWGVLLIVFTLVCGVLIVKLLIDPMKRFFIKTKELGIVGDVVQKPGRPAANDDMGKFTMVFDQVTELLSKVESRQLFPDIVGQSRSMRGVFNQIVKVAPKDSTVLITGETGTGKELIARSIHQHSKRRNRPFVAINCAAIPEGLLESELFGHERGAFTGANTAKPGKFELADAGTLFLDEIGDMPLDTQAKILRAIEENTIQRLGAVKSIDVNVRFIAATHRSLDQLVEAGNFREDLFYRLNVFHVMLPPLRNRREDIPLLADHFLSQRGFDNQLSSEALQLLISDDWPGNVRELKNALESAAVLADGPILPANLPISIHKRGSMPFGERQHHQKPAVAMGTTIPPDENNGLDMRLRQLERQLIIDALRQVGGVQVKAAALLGIKQRSLWHRIKKHEINVADFKFK
ncbi:MAG: sigma-54-dependent Fis family transcriptional regulator [Proteobacteria bacterium]|nr:MAG: sigma-54-dependent Fis family transcriptional regulator [Pseudomonadota bacterium]PIE67661.1 MAG: sigma-54-dependent Fis family transcriptional regulator [Deltaproteobacteria bacterium]